MGSLKVKAAPFVTPSLPNVPELALSVPFVEGTPAEELEKYRAWCKGFPENRKIPK
jgi:hypothetical protein